MYFKGDIIITDPCYVIRERKGRPSTNDFPALANIYCKPFTEFTDEENAAYKEYEELKAKWEIETPDDIAIAEFGSDDIYEEELKSIGESPVWPSMKFDNIEDFDMEKWKKDQAEYIKLYGEWQSKIFTADEGYRSRNFFKNLGFSQFLMSTTYYGDWSCHTFEQGTNKVLGQFCADGGEVCVLLLDEVLKYNPDYRDHIDNPHCVTVIKDFDGDVELKTTIESGSFEYEGKTEDYTEKILTVIGKGNINFYTSQTGL